MKARAAKGILLLATIISTLSFFGASVYALDTSNFTQTINAGTLAIDIVDGSYVTVGSPSVAFPTATFSFACQTSSGTFGTASQRIYVSNPDAADNGWSASLAGSAATAVWDGAASDYDFNDSSGGGCTDGGDADSVGGQMTVDASVGTLTAGACSGCTTTNITKGSAASFVQGTTDSITLLTAAAGSDDIGDWALIGVDVDQDIPAQQAAASDYDINMVLSVVSN
ncbi:MAG: hypothetical protein QY318_03615 [Candidatus Dojkabacteria bacterium]|nr:MAG: hypothetical protein QY318_03615 [Candidatus Dojkabacteria bacterium]